MMEILYTWSNLLITWYNNEVYYQLQYFNNNIITLDDTHKIKLTSTFNNWKHFKA